MAANSPTTVFWAGCIIEYDAEGDVFSYRSNSGAWDESVPIEHPLAGVVGLTLLPGMGIDSYACNHAYGNRERPLIEVLTHVSDT
ncbi:MAG TPA: hypothetical protein VM487_12945, partial [Phycisphaerae bacterium]|nr:hypothetical protein [Phycisphaerae bacterium]